MGAEQCEKCAFDCETHWAEASSTWGHHRWTGLSFGHWTTAVLPLILNMEDGIPESLLFPPLPHKTNKTGLLTSPLSQPLTYWLTSRLCIHITTIAPTFHLIFPNAPIYLMTYPPNYFTQHLATSWLIHPHNNWHTFLSTNIPTYPLTYPPTDTYLLKY